jgi:hypothetical protein
MTTGGEREVFAARARESGVALTEAEIDNLFVGYGLLQHLVAELGAPPETGLEPAFVFKSVSLP